MQAREGTKKEGKAEKKVEKEVKGKIVLENRFGMWPAKVMIAMMGTICAVRFFSFVYLCFFNCCINN